MTESIPQSEVVARCKTMPTQHATAVNCHATGQATPVQRPSLKALALQTLGRNNACNTHATVTEKLRNNEVFSERGLLRTDESIDSIRNRLLTIVAAEGIDPARVHAQDDDDIAECRGLSDATLRDWMRLRASCAVCCGTLLQRTTP